MIGSIPVILSDELRQVALPFQHVVPWSKFAFFVPEHLPRSDLESWFSVLLLTPHEEIDRRRRIMAHYAPDVLWRAEGSRVTENILLTAYTDCLPGKNGSAS